MPRLVNTILLSLACLTALPSLGCGSNPPPATSNQNPAADARTQPRQPDDRQIEPEIRKIVATVLNIEPNAVDVSAPLSKQKVAADELDLLEIVMTIEETLGVEIKDEEIANESGGFREDLSVKKLAEIVSGKKSRK